MNVSIGERWENFIEKAVKEGRYGSASEVVREGLRLVEEREAKLEALREETKAAIESSGRLTAEEVGAHLDTRAHGNAGGKVTAADLDWLAARRVGRIIPSEDAGTFVSRMRDEDER